MSSSTYPASGPANRSALTAPGWIETPSTRDILERIQNPTLKNAFIAAVASMSYRGVSPAQIEAHYAAAPPESIPGYHPPILNHQLDQQLETMSMADAPTRSQRSGDSRRTGADEGRSHGNRGSHAGPPLHSSGSGPPISTGNHHPRDRGLGSGSARYGSYSSSSHGYPRNGTTPYGANPPSSGNQFGGDFTLYGSDGGYSSGSDYSASTLYPSDSNYQQGRDSRGYEQGRRDSRRAYY